ncbi:hypothetical protein [Leptolyngbya sp. 7M]|uniref:hypothetical protein n=1 Tax=Leptolyngbya sp. 7M TaxID=2812896 RepID=UPI001B8D0334|nr:hypothetical protein [Leptolyngbya sp. 7M]QYO67615.1 hypothetical protein JVX88_12950 [Leptolyngbya sp. 7M]
MNIQLVESIKQLILALPQEEQLWLKAQLTEESNRQSAQVVDLNPFSGILQLQEDPLEFQQRIRDEWT